MALQHKKCKFFFVHCSAASLRARCEHEFYLKQLVTCRHGGQSGYPDDIFLDGIVIGLALQRNGPCLGGQPSGRGATAADTMEKLLVLGAGWYRPSSRASREPRRSQ